MSKSVTFVEPDADVENEFGDELYLFRQLCNGGDLFYQVPFSWWDLERQTFRSFDLMELPMNSVVTCIQHTRGDPC